jgi:hypothetical protein
MKLLLERGSEWYLGNRRIVGSDLSSSWLGPEEPWLRVVDGDRLIVCESFVEALDVLGGVYCGLIRLWDQYSFSGGLWLWMGSGGYEIPGMSRYVGFMGEWPGRNWSAVRRNVLNMCEREFVIKREWMPSLVESLTEV